MMQVFDSQNIFGVSHYNRNKHKSLCVDNFESEKYLVQTEMFIFG